MESPFLTPAFVVAIVTGAIGFIVWLVRLESKLNAADTENRRLRTELEAVSRRLDEHERNQAIHFDQRISQQVDKSNERRFVNIEQQLIQINQKLDRMAEK